MTTHKTSTSLKQEEIFFRRVFHELKPDKDYLDLTFWFNKNGAMAVIIPPMRKTIFYRQKYGTSTRYKKRNTPVSIALPWQTFLAVPRTTKYDVRRCVPPFFFFSSTNPAKDKDCVFSAPYLPNMWGENPINQRICLGNESDNLVYGFYGRVPDDKVQSQVFMKKFLLNFINTFYSATFNNDVESRNPQRRPKVNPFDNNNSDLNNWLNPDWTLRGVTSKPFLIRNSQWNTSVDQCCADIFSTYQYNPLSV